MASLVPDTNYTPNTTAASNAYVAAQNSFGEALMKPVGLLSKMYTDEYERKLQADKMAQEQKRWDITNARAEEQANRERDKYGREILKEAATSEAMQATLDPSKFTQGKVLGEQQAAEAGIANLSPEEQVTARQQMAASYDPKLSGQQWLTGATSATNVDQGKLFDTKAKMYDIAASTPGTPEYEAKVNALKEQKQWEANLTHKNRMAEIAAGKDNSNNVLSLAAFASGKGIKLDPTDSKETIMMKINQKTAEDRTAADNVKIQNQRVLELADKAKEEEKAAAKLKGNVLTPDSDTGKFMQSLDVPLSTYTFGFNDAPRLESFINNSDVKGALIKQNIGSKELEKKIETLLKANDNDMETTLEILGGQLTGGKATDF